MESQFVHFKGGLREPLHAQAFLVQLPVYLFDSFYNTVCHPPGLYQCFLASQLLTQVNVMPLDDL